MRKAAVRCVGALAWALAALSPLARAQEDTPVKFRCVVQDVRVHTGHVHVRCANKGLTGVYEFAAESDQPYSKRVATAATNALRARGSVMITYAPSLDLNPDGCAPRTCRKIIDAGPYPPIASAPPQPRPSPMAASPPLDDGGSVSARPILTPTRLPQSPDDAVLQHTAPGTEAAPLLPPKSIPLPPPFQMAPIED